MTASPETFLLAGNGAIPNNPKLPLLVYRRVIDLSGTPNPEAVIERKFAGHGWGNMWRNGVYEYVHYHSRIHEVMGIARGRVRVRFGGEKGPEIDLGTGDVA